MRFDFIRSVYTVLVQALQNAMQTKTAENETVWSPTQVQFLYRHKNGRYYVRTYAGGKGNWTSLRTKLLSVAKNRMKEHVEAVGKLTFGEAIHSYRERLAASDVRPNTKAYREAGLKLVLRSWELGAKYVC